MEKAISAKILPVSLRPKSLGKMIGQATMVKAIRKQIAKRPPQVWLLSGGTGTGKTTLARIIAASYQCDHQKLWGAPCTKCWAAWSSFSIHERNASQSVGVNEAGEIAELMAYLPNGPGKKRVMILDEAHQISKQGQNLLLKPLEEPPDHAVWILCTTEPNKLLATLRRRCTSYVLKGLTYGGQETLLKTSAKAAGVSGPIDSLLDAVATQQITSPALILMALEKFAAGLPAEQCVIDSDAGIDTFSICKAATSGDTRKLVALLKEVTPEHNRWLLGSITGWLRGSLLKTPSRKALDAYLLLTDNPPFMEDKQLHHWLLARLIQTCSIFKNR